AGQPINGGLLPPGVLVNVLDSFGNVATGSSATVSVTLKGATKTATAVAGGAAFTGLSVARPRNGPPPVAALGHAPATSAPFNIVSANQVADHLTFTVVPTGITDSGALLGDVTVEVRDANNNKMTGDNTTSIQLTPQLVTAPGSPVSGYLAGLTTQTVTNGSVTFDTLVLNRNKNPSFDIPRITTGSPV